MWRYDQTSGDISHDGSYEGRGYSGHGEGRNNPALEAKPMVGPIPGGLWAIGSPYTHPKLGPLVMNLTPVGHDARGRSLFRIHGDNSQGNESASEGCIVAGRAIRQAIADSLSPIESQIFVSGPSAPFSELP
jgi:hypothetical protein